MEKSNKIQRSEVWEQIYKVVKTLPREETECDAPDAPSVASELEELFLKLLPIHDVSGSLRSNAIEFAKWLQHLDNGTTHYNPFTKEETKSIGFSPYDCLIDEIYTIEELYDKWQSLSNDR